MSFLRQYTINHYGGLDADKPSELPYGDFYWAEDINVLYKYNYSKIPIAINEATSGAAIQITEVANNYSSLTPGGSLGQIAYVYNSQGTSWAPGSLGGTYYPAGFYVWNGSTWLSDRNAIANQLELNTRDSEIRVTQLNKDQTIGGIIDSSKKYFIDGVIDMGTTQITVPPTGLTLGGASFDVAGLVSTADNYTMFVSESPEIGSGNILGVDYFVTTSGTNSKVYELYDATGFSAFEFARVNFIDCSSLGDMYNYRQGLEEGTGRFGGAPSLTLHGTWLGGYRITTSIVRSLSASMATPLFKAGTAFLMNSRFLTDINCDLPTLASLFDFSQVNFPNPGTLDIRNTIITRDGVLSPKDTNLTPNISASDLASFWKGNNGLPNTFVGGIATISTQIETVIATINTPVQIAGTFANTDLQHFDSPSNGRLRHLGINPREYTVNFDFVLEGAANAEYTIDLIKNDGVDNILFSQTRVVNNLQGGRDITYFSSMANVILNQNEFLFWNVKNITGIENCTLEIDSSWSVEER